MPLSTLLKLLRKPKLAQEDKNKLHIATFLPDNPVIIEAGAADGTDTLEMSKMWPTGRIYGFEPHPHFYKIASEKTKNCKNVILHQLALAEQNGWADFNVSTINQHEVFGSSSLLAPKEHKIVHPQVEFKETMRVETVNLDQWALKHQVGKVDFMWLDMQGLEPAVLRSCPTILKTCSLVFTEVSLIETYEGVMLYPEFKEWMASQGFSVEMEDLPYKDMGNVLFRRD